MKHRILRKIRATFLSLSEEKKATSAGVKRLSRSRRPLAYSLYIPFFKDTGQLVLGKKIFKGFLPYMGMVAILVI